jgi:hypothetical protein
MDCGQSATALAALIARQFTEASRHISGRPLALTSEGWCEFEIAYERHQLMGARFTAPVAANIQFRV